MISVYVETSAANYFLSNLNGKGAEATRKLQVSKGREWYISTTVLWELLQIRDHGDLDERMYLSSFLFSDNLLKSAAEITIDYIEQGEPDYFILNSPFTNSLLGTHWKRACRDKGFTFRYDDPNFKNATKYVKDISRYLSIITYDGAIIETSLRGDLACLKDFIEAVYDQYYTDDVDELVYRSLNNV